MNWGTRGILPTELSTMNQSASDVLSSAARQGQATVEDVSLLVKMVHSLTDEVDMLHWRATVAAMALDGRVGHQDVRLHGGQP